MKFLTTLAVGFATISLSNSYPSPSRPSYLYTLYNNPGNASIVAMMVSKNGTIMESTQTSTGGGGLSGITGPGQPKVGALFSADSVVVADNYLFTVNAGSNTLSMFYINPTSPMKPTLVGTPASTLGQFPMSVAYSSKLSTACVLNGGAIGGVTCFSVDPVIGLTVLDTAPRSISAGLNQTTPPTGPFSTASDIMFNPSSSALVASIKGNPLTKSPGYIYAWPVTKGKVSTTAVVNSLPSVILDFSLTFTSNDFELLITDPALGADFLDVASDLTITVDQPVNITYQKAACWSYYLPALQTVFVIDTARTNITALSTVDGSITDTIEYGVVGAIDPAVIGSSLYAVTQNASIVNIDIAGLGSGKTARQVQTFNPQVPGLNPSIAPLAGLASYVG